MGRIGTRLRRTVTDAERDDVIAQFAERLANSGPFRNLRFVNGDLTRTATQVLATAGLDDARTTRLLVLDPAQFSLRNGIEDVTLTALNVAMGLGSGHDRIPVEWASSAVYAVVNTQRRALARNVATEYLAQQKALQTAEVQADADLKATGTRELTEAKERLEKAVKRAYQHVVYLAQPDPTIDRSIETVTLEDDNQTALDGSQVWKVLAEREKVFDTGQFSARALQHNLRDVDYDRPLSEIRDAFFNAPRLPLLNGGERDLQRAIYEAVESGLMTIIDASETAVAVTDAGQVSLSSTTLRLAKPQSTDTGVAPEPGAPEAARPGLDADMPGRLADLLKNDESATRSDVAEKFLTFPLVGNLLSNAEGSEDLARLFLELYTVLDEGQASFVQGTLQFVMEADAAEKIAEMVRSLGLKVSIRDQ